MNILRQILKEAKHLPKPVQNKLIYNLKRGGKEGNGEAAQAVLRLVTFLSNKGRDDSVLFRHFKKKYVLASNCLFIYFPQSIVLFSHFTTSLISR